MQLSSIEDKAFLRLSLGDFGRLRPSSKFQDLVLILRSQNSRLLETLSFQEVLSQRKVSVISHFDLNKLERFQYIVEFQSNSQPKFKSSSRTELQINLLSLPHAIVFLDYSGHAFLLRRYAQRHHQGLARPSLQLHHLQHGCL